MTRLQWETLSQAVHTDLEALVSPTDPDPYGYGKQIQRIARILLISKEVMAHQSASNTELGPLFEHGLKVLEESISKWLSKDSSPLVYDTTFGGIVSKAGLADQAADFGNGYYNDHHFQ